ncbi:guanylate-binding protein 6-like isoform X7 [Myiozetetes cayanensis]|nr:guanylate-binding protein 6-like isoform X6 [Myiozetetes cayanensis]XP_050176752.1 guanylate-binding protein 6-like isoform X7 [Myiozetetes cayanensis]
MWMCCLPHPHLSDHTLVLLHTEVHLDEGDLESSRWLLVLTVLLCSSLIHTSLGNIAQQDMERLRWLSELPQLITCRASPERGALSDSHRFALFFPDFVWAVLDCTREPQDEDGQEISEDEYLERALRLRPGSDARAQRHNLPRECIRQFFPERRCFLFQRHPEETLAGLQQQKFLRFLQEEAQPKTLPGGLVVTGELLGRLAEIYVGQIRAGAVPCLQRALQDVAPAANAAAAAAAARLYRERTERLELPLDSVTELLRLHGRCEREALELFMERAFPDGICNGQAEFMRQMEALKDKFFSDNERLSRARCEKALQNLSQDMGTRSRDRSRGIPGGYLQALVEEYWKLPGKGLKATAVLQEFLRSRSIPSTERSIRTWREQYLRELEQRMRAEKEDEQRQRQQEQLRRRSEHQRQLKEKLEDFAGRRLQEHRRLMALKSQEEKSLRQDGFQEQADKLFSVIMELDWEYHGRGRNRGSRKGGNAGWNGRNAGWNGGDGGWNGGDGGWNGGDGGLNGTGNSNSNAWIPVLVGIVAILALILLRI